MQNYMNVDGISHWSQMATSTAPSVPLALKPGHQWGGDDSLEQENEVQVHIDSDGVDDTTRNGGDIGSNKVEADGSDKESEPVALVVESRREPRPASNNESPVLRYSPELSPILADDEEDTFDDAKMAEWQSLIANNHSPSRINTEPATNQDNIDDNAQPSALRWSVDLRLVPCRICGASSSGYHFGVISCEGCKGFFRRTMTHNLESTYTCFNTQSTGTRCGIQALGRKCKKCRFDLCQEMGMTTEGGKTGRHSYLRRIQTHRHVEQLRAENRLLPAPLLRFRRRQKQKPSPPSAQQPPSHQQSLPTNAKAVPSAFKLLPSSKPNKSNYSPRAQQQQQQQLQQQQQQREGTFKDASELLRLVVAASTSSNNMPNDLSSAAVNLLANSLINNNNNGSANTNDSGSKSDGANKLTTAACQKRVAPNSSISNGKEKQAYFATSSSTADNPVLSPTSAKRQLLASSFIAGQAAATSSDMSAANLMLLAMMKQENGVFLKDTLLDGIQNKNTSSTKSQHQKPTESMQRSSSPVSNTAALTVPSPPPSLANLAWIFDCARARFNLTGLALTAELQDSHKSGSQNQPDASSPYSWPLTSSLSYQQSSLLAVARSDWLISSAVSSVKMLEVLPIRGEDLKNTSMGIDQAWTSLMKCFEENSNQLLPFTRSLFGYQHLHFADRTLLFVEAAFPVFFSQLALDQCQTAKNNSDPLQEVAIKYFTHSNNSASQSPGDNGAVKSVRMTIAEYSILCSLLFFNSEIPGLMDRCRVKAIVTEYRKALELFLQRSFGNSAEARIAQLHDHVDHFRESSSLFSWFLKNTGCNAGNHEQKQQTSQRSSSEQNLPFFSQQQQQQQQQQGRNLLADKLLTQFLLTGTMAARTSQDERLSSSSGSGAVYPSS